MCLYVEDLFLCSACHRAVRERSRAPKNRFSSTKTPGEQEFPRGMCTCACVMGARVSMHVFRVFFFVFLFLKSVHVRNSTKQLHIYMLRVCVCVCVFFVCFRVRVRCACSSNAKSNFGARARASWDFVCALVN